MVAAADCCFWTNSGQGVFGVVFGLGVVLLAGNAVTTGFRVVEVTGFLVVPIVFLVVETGFPVVIAGFLVCWTLGFLVVCWTLGLG